MRSRVLHSSGIDSSYLKASYLSADTTLLERCLKQLWKNVLPTLLILICCCAITLYLSGLIDRAKLEHRAGVTEKSLAALQGVEH